MGQASQFPGEQRLLPDSIERFVAQRDDFAARDIIAKTMPGP